MNETVLNIIFDLSAVREEISETKVFFNDSAGSDNSTINLLSFIIENQEVLRSDLMHFLDQIISRMPIEGRKAFSRSEINEKSHYKNNFALNFFKFRALLFIISESNYNTLVIHGATSAQHKLIAQYCQENSLILVSKNTQAENKGFKSKLLKYGWLVVPILLLRSIWRSFRAPKTQFERSKNLVVTYYPAHYFHNGSFVSKYYDRVSLLLKKDFDWLFLNVGGVSNARKEISSFKSRRFENYNFLESYLSLTDTWGVLRQYFKQRKILRCFDDKDLFAYQGVSYKLILEEEWQKFRNKTLLENIIYDRQFYNFLCKNRYSNILYLMEYQPWEQCLLEQALKVSNNVSLYGVVHSIFRDNLMNYYYGPIAHATMYQPNFVLLNSSAFVTRMIENGFKLDSIVEVEAQRFSHLAEIGCSKYLDLKQTLVVFTSIDIDETEYLLETLKKSQAEDFFNKILIKPHPNLPVGRLIKSLEFLIDVQEIDCSMSEALSRSNIVLAASSSSVVLEALLAGKELITLLSIKQMPVLAIKKHRNLRIAFDSKQMQEYFRSFLQVSKKSSSDEALDLNIDPELEKWKKIINKMESLE